MQTLTRWDICAIQPATRLLSAMTLSATRALLYPRGEYHNESMFLLQLRIVSCSVSAKLVLPCIIFGIRRLIDLHPGDSNFTHERERSTAHHGRPIMQEAAGVRTSQKIERANRPLYRAMATPGGETTFSISDDSNYPPEVCIFLSPDLWQL